jgi:hypothetical protein
VEDSDLFDDLGIDTDADSGTDSDEGPDARAEGETGEDGEKGRKRTREDDLMSKWQSEQAKNKRLEARLAALEAQSKGGDKGAEIPPDVRQWMDAARDAARERFYEMDPRLAEYGIPASSITGDTPDQMRASVKAYRDLIDSVETKARNKVLAEHGIVAESVGSSRFTSKDFVSMSDEEFDKVISQVTGGRL